MIMTNGLSVMPRVLLVGYDPETVDYSNPALPPGMNAQKIRNGLEIIRPFSASAFPMMILVRRLEHLLDVAVQHPQYSDPRKHCRRRDRTRASVAARILGTNSYLLRFKRGPGGRTMLGSKRDLVLLLAALTLAGGLMIAGVSVAMDRLLYPDQSLAIGVSADTQSAGSTSPRN
jgi:hypothetical protein